MNWTENSSPKEGISFYEHTILETPLGKFIIEWKSWKEDPSYDIMLNGEWINCVYDLDEAKQKVSEYLNDKYEALKLFLKL